MNTTLGLEFVYANVFLFQILDQNVGIFQSTPAYYYGINFQFYLGQGNMGSIHKPIPIKFTVPLRIPNFCTCYHSKCSFCHLGIGIDCQT